MRLNEVDLTNIVGKKLDMSLSDMETDMPIEFLLIKTTDLGLEVYIKQPHEIGQQQICLSEEIADDKMLIKFSEE